MRSFKKKIYEGDEGIIFLLFFRIVGIGEILVPTFQEFFQYCSEIKQKNGQYYNEYYEKFEGYTEILKIVVNNVLFFYWLIKKFIQR